MPTRANESYDQERRRKLNDRWHALPASLQTEQQLIGRQELGCGATVGIMPRCDFACTACYLGTGANRTKPASMAEAKRQLYALRDYLGPGGNLQLTDGEVTLRPVHEVIELLLEADRVGLTAMLMTHGETFRRDPQLLSKLVVEGRLREVSIHVDTLQRGRRDPQYRHASTEAELHGLRHEFAELIRGVRKQTGIPLRAASTVTVSSSNLQGVSSIVRWFQRNADAFRLLSFQPIAQVGRTSPGALGGVSVDELWDEIRAGLYKSTNLVEKKLEGTYGFWNMGHAACNRIMSGYVLQNGGSYSFSPITPTKPDGRGGERSTAFSRFLTRYGAICNRQEGKRVSLARLARLLVAAPILIGVQLPWAFCGLLRCLLPESGKLNSIAKLLMRSTSGKARLSRLTIASHHFMSQEELATPLGQERLQDCTFRIAAPDGRLVSMCEFNNNGFRDQYYDSLGATED